MLNKQNTGLIVVDIQGKLARLVDNSEQLINNCEKLIQGAKALDLPVVWLEQNPEKLGPTAASLTALLSEQDPVIKFTFDACEEPSFMDAIVQSGRTSWLVCGIEAHICVYQTASHLQHLGYDVQLVSDCVSSRTAQNKALALGRMAAGGITLTGLEMCLFELVKDCRAPEFKNILALIK